MDTESAARLRTVIARAARELNRTTTGEGLSPSQWSVLGLVAGRGPLGLAELNEIEGINPSMLSRIVGKLDDLGLIRRLQDPTDLRAVRVEITSEGSVVNARVRARRTEAVSACLDRLPQETVDRLLEALPALEAFSEEFRRHSQPA